MAIPREERLKEGSKFSLLFKKGKSVHNKILVMYYLPAPVGVRQTGFSVGKKLGNAVMRNRIKRKMKAAYRELIHHVPRGYYILFIGRKGIVHAPYNEIKEGMDELLKRGKIWREGQN